MRRMMLCSLSATLCLMLVGHVQAQRGGAPGGARGGGMPSGAGTPRGAPAVGVPRGGGAMYATPHASAPAGALRPSNVYYGGAHYYGAGGAQYGAYHTHGTPPSVAHQPAYSHGYYGGGQQHYHPYYGDSHSNTNFYFGLTIGGWGQPYYYPPSRYYGAPYQSGYYQYPPPYAVYPSAGVVYSNGGGGYVVIGVGF